MDPFEEIEISEEFAEHILDKQGKGYYGSFLVQKAKRVLDEESDSS